LNCRRVSYALRMTGVKASVYIEYERSHRLALIQPPNFDVEGDR
jgi:hypothetical protein